MKNIDGEIYHNNIMVLIATARGLFILSVIPYYRCKQKYMNERVTSAMHGEMERGHFSQVI